MKHVLLPLLTFITCVKQHWLQAVHTKLFFCRAFVRKCHNFSSWVKYQMLRQSGNGRWKDRPIKSLQPHSANSRRFSTRMQDWRSFKFYLSFATTPSQVFKYWILKYLGTFQPEGETDAAWKCYLSFATSPSQAPHLFSWLLSTQESSSLNTWYYLHCWKFASWSLISQYSYTASQENTGHAKPWLRVVGACAMRMMHASLEVADRSISMAYYYIY